MNLVYAQQGRQILDLIVGFKISLTFFTPSAFKKRWSSNMREGNSYFVYHILYVCMLG